MKAKDDVTCYKSKQQGMKANDIRIYYKSKLSKDQEYYNNRKTHKILHFYYSSLICQKAITVVSTVVKLENFNNTKEKN